jgi:hypothetical protein
MKMSLATELSGFSTVLIITDAEKAVGNMTEVIDALLKKHDAGIFVTVNHTHKVVEKILSDVGIVTDRLFFIDCISRSVKGPKLSKGCLYLDSPENLTELGIGVSQGLEYLGDGKKFVYIDSLGTFLLYNSVGTMSRFSHFMVTKICLSDVSGVFLSVEEESEDKLLDELRLFCEKTIRLTK